MPLDFDRREVCPLPANRYSTGRQSIMTTMMGNKEPGTQSSIATALHQPDA
jgi:hypothetical protein